MGCDEGLLQASAGRHGAGSCRFERLAVVDCSIMCLYVRVATRSGKSDGAAEKGWKRELGGAWEESRGFRFGAACLGGDSPSCGVRPGDLVSYVGRASFSRCD